MTNNKKVFLIRKEGGSRILAITKVIPREWEIVTIDILKTTKGSVTAKIERVR